MLMNTHYGTFPSIIHKPGVGVPMWDKLVKLFFNLSSRAEMPDDLTIVTWNTGGVSLLEKCLSHLGLPCVVLGRGQKNWRNPIKITLLNQALSDIKTKWIVGLDSFDVLVWGGVRRALEQFEAMDCRLLYNSGPINYPPVRPGFGDFEAVVGRGHRFPHLNGGAFIGETTFCRTFFAAAAANGHQKRAESEWWAESEQAYIKDVFPLFYPEVQLDYTCSIFQVIHPRSPQDWLKVQVGFL